LAKPEPETVPKAQHDGLMSKYQSEKHVWETKFAELESRISQLTNRDASQAQAPSQPKAPAAPKTDNAANLDVLDQAIQQRKAESYRNLLVESMGRELGVAGLEMFSDNIPVLPPKLGADGSIDDSAQRAAIKAFADKLSGVQGEASQRTKSAIMEGMTPGSAPGAGVPTAESEIYQEFQDVMQVYGSEEFDTLDKSEQRRIEKRYSELLEDPAVQNLHEGETRPTMSWQEMQKTIRNLVKQANAAQGRGQTPYGNMA